MAHTRRTLAARKYLAAIPGLLCALFLVGTALAEGGWDSYISNGRVGFESRSWTDRNIDSTSTSVRFENCRDQEAGNNGDNVTVQLYREISFAPDEKRGLRTLDCFYYDTEYWGDVPAGSYHFTITSITNGTGEYVYVNPVKVRY